MHKPAQEAAEATQMNKISYITPPLKAIKPASHKPNATTTTTNTSTTTTTTIQKISEKHHPASPNATSSIYSHKNCTRTRPAPPTPLPRT